MEVEQATAQLHALVSDIMTIKGDDPRISSLQNVIGMVYTLIEEDRVRELERAISAFFPEYSNERSMLVPSEN